MSRSPRAVVVALGALVLLAGCTGGGAGGTSDASGTAARGVDLSSDGAGPGEVSGTVTVAAAADLRFALDEVLALVAEQHPDVVTTVTYGSSGQFLQQIDNGAPFDLYLSADAAYPRELVDAGLAEEDELFDYAVGRLALWVPDGSDLDPAVGLSLLADPRVDRVAIANPEHAPYGVAAVAAMREAGVHDDVEDRLVLGENVSQAAEFVRTGQADAGVVALSLVLAEATRGVGRWEEVPPGTFPPLLQGGVVLARAQDPAAARAVRDVLLSEAGREVLDSYGFARPVGATAPVPTP